MEKILYTIDFLGGFTPSKGYKQVTHPLDLDDKEDFLFYVNRCRTALLNYEGILPDGLYDFLFGFFYGPEWKDANGITHEQFCGSGQWVDWCLNNPRIHPLSPNSGAPFKKDIIAFKHSIRIYAGDLPAHLQNTSTENIKLDFEFEPFKKFDAYKQLKRFDAYTDVSRLKGIFASIVNDIDTSDYSREHQLVRVASLREKKELPDDVVIDTISIEHIGSFPFQPLQSAMNHFNNDTGGFLGDLAKSCEGYFLLSIDSTWEEKPVRWNLVRLNGTPELEEIPQELTPIQGFRYCIRIPHKR